MNEIENIKRIYSKIKNDIEKRLKDFKEGWKSNDEKIFYELVFCLLTPQSKAKICWNAVERMTKKNLILGGDKKEIIDAIEGVRFKYKKAEYIIEARNLFSIDGKIKIKDFIKKIMPPSNAREWMVKNVKGMGYKEASHFLRNIGFGENFSILDRHILKNLKFIGIIEEIPSSLNKNRYIT
ncbi:MAG: N-glycosylase/DNA lyase, partial [Thermoplasmata archaeon]|nr:N-glycosylase/DNA lyase [Thermoplasmata archaeon]